jgi:hypothetical protein
MSFNNVGSFFLAPGASVRLVLSWNPPGDHGAQWIMAHAAKGQPPTELMVSEFSKQLRYSIAWHRSDCTSGWNYDSYYYRYLVTVKNLGSYGVWFSLQGGGNT